MAAPTNVKPTAPTASATGAQSQAAAPVAKPVQAAPFQISSMTATGRNKWFKLLVYGSYGAGKTELVGTSVDVENMRDVLMINAEAGDLTYLETDRIKNVQLIDEVRVQNFKQLSFVKDFLKAHCIYRDRGDDAKLLELQQKVFGEGIFEPDRLRKYKTVIVDSLSEIEQFNMYDLLGISVDQALHLDMNTAEFKEYKLNFNKMQLFIRGMRDLPMHVLMTAAQDYEQDEQKRQLFRPHLTGKLAAHIQGFFDVVAWLQVGQSTEDKVAPRRLWVQPVGGKFDAKNRRASLKKAFLEDPTMASLMKDMGL